MFHEPGALPKWRSAPRWKTPASPLRPVFLFCCCTRCAMGRNRSQPVHAHGSRNPTGLFRLRMRRPWSQSQQQGAKLWRFHLFPQTSGKTSSLLWGTAKGKFLGLAHSTLLKESQPLTDFAFRKGVLPGLDFSQARVKLGFQVTTTRRRPRCCIRSQENHKYSRRISMMLLSFIECYC